MPLDFASPVLYTVFMSMPVIFFLWVGSLLAMSGIIAFAVFRRSTYATSETTFVDFVRGEMYHVAVFFRAIVFSALKNGSALIISGAGPLRRGNEMFMERMFGRVKIERGRASSFFLKRIAEHKDVIKRGGEFF